MGAIRKPSYWDIVIDELLDSGKVFWVKKGTGKLNV
jgi:hypothetical protein